MNQFLTKFSGTQLSRRCWRLDRPLQYLDDKYGRIDMGVGEITDLASIEALRYIAPVVFSLLSGYGNAACAIHDSLYKSGQLSRKDADKVLYRALVAEGVEHWRASIFYMGVRLFGGRFYNDDSKPLGASATVQL